MTAPDRFEASTRSATRSARLSGSFVGIDFVGIDVSKASLEVALIGSEKEVSTSQTVPNTEDGFGALIGWLARQTDAGLEKSPEQVRVCLEASGGYERPVAARFLHERGLTVSVVNLGFEDRPARSAARRRARRPTRSKTDPLEDRPARRPTRTSADRSDRLGRQSPAHERLRRQPLEDRPARRPTRSKTDPPKTARRPIRSKTDPLEDRSARRPIRSKTDPLEDRSARRPTARVDARLLARFCQREEPSPWEPLFF